MRGMHARPASVAHDNSRRARARSRLRLLLLRGKGLARWIGAALVAAVVATACGGEATRFQAAPSSAATSAPIPAATPQLTADPSGACINCWPLNGKPLDGASAQKRPLLVKIDNVPAARPHYGITQADMVIEELVEGYVTRLAAFYQSQDPQTIGGVRSARLADRSLTTMVNGALVYSGTSDFAWSQISQDAADGRYVELSADHSGGYYRVAFRQAPYNLFTSAAAQRDALTKLQKATVAEVPKWAFLAASDHPARWAECRAGSPPRTSRSPTARTPARSPTNTTRPRRRTRAGRTPRVSPCATWTL